MNYLYRYLLSLDEQESARVAAADLSPRERQTLSVLLAMRPAADAPREEALRTLSMSGTMFDKTCSVVLRKAYEALVPEGGLALLADLERRRLRQLTLRELARQERELTEGSVEGHAGFYRSVFELLHTRFSIHYDPVLARAVARKWRNHDPSEGTMLYIDASLAGMEIWKAAAGEADQQEDRRLLARLKGLQKRAASTSDPRARYRLLRAWMVYYGQIDIQAGPRGEIIDEAIALCEGHPDRIPVSELESLRLMRAEHEYFFGEDHAVAWSIYDGLIVSDPVWIAGQMYHVNKFVQLCLIVGEYSRAEQLIDLGFSRQWNDEDVGRAKMAAISRTKLYLLTGRLDEARRHLDHAFELNQKRFFVQFEIECRLLQTAWFALRGDDAAVVELAPANLKYLRSKGYSIESGSRYPWFFKLAVALIEERHTGRRLTRKLESQYDVYQQGAAAQYGVLLRKLRGG
jgi:hypothetical protein